MSSAQRSHSVPTENRHAVRGPENVQSPVHLTATRWHTTRGRRPQQNVSPSGRLRETGTDVQGPASGTNSYSSAATIETEQESDHTTPKSGASSGDSPWTRKTLLTLDGGGIRGYSSLLILQALMMETAALEQAVSQTHSSVHPLPQRLRRPVHFQRNRTDTMRQHPSPQQTQGPVFGPACASSFFLPAHYFDYIAGTSTGGLIAIMLGRLHMTVDECLEAYENLANYVFGHPRHWHIRRPPFVPRDKYDHKRLEKIFKEIVKERNPNGLNSTEFRQPNEDMCRTIVIAWQKLSSTGTRIPHLFRSYHHPKSFQKNILERNPGEPDKHKIWEVGRATSAAPSYFKAARLEEDHPKSEYIDGGLGANNPTEEAYRSIKQLNNNNRHAVQVLVSIGTGKNLEADPSPSTGYAKYMAYINTAAKWAAESEKTHHAMLDATRDFADYFRLNVEHGIGKIKLDAWKGKKGCKTLELIRTKTQDYLNSQEGQRQITASARQLVDVRRARSSQEYMDRWERFCYGVEYFCCLETCPHGKDKRYDNREALRRHIRDFHRSEYNNLESLLDDCKHFPEDTQP